MKKVLSIISLSAVLLVLVTACNTGPAPVKPVSYEDTVGFAQFQAWKAQNERVDPVAYAAQPAAPVAKKSVKKTSNSGTMTSVTTNNAKTKKGWSKAAKYAAIGGGGGAILGAVINKRNRVAGGILGGVLGGGIGYGIGRSQDKKDGRVN